MRTIRIGYGLAVLCMSQTEDCGVSSCWASLVCESVTTRATAAAMASSAARFRSLVAGFLGSAESGNAFARALASGGHGIDAPMA